MELGMETGGNGGDYMGMGMSDTIPTSQSSPVYCAYLPMQFYRTSTL